MRIKGYYFITDSRLSLAGDISDVRNALAAGVRIIQYRQKDADSLTMYNEALQIRKVCRKALLIINDRLDIALSVGADGVHLGQGDLPCAVARKILGKNKIIGVTVHDLKQAVRARRSGADYLGVAPVFSTNTKSDAGDPVGVELIRQIKRKVGLPITAIGGITYKNASLVIQAGADSLCAISAVVKSGNVREEINKFQALYFCRNRTFSSV